MMTFDQAILTNPYILLDKEGLLLSPTEEPLLKLNANYYAQLATKVGGSAKLSGITVDIKQEGDRLALAKHTEIKDLIAEHGSIEIDPLTGDIMTLAEISIGNAQPSVIESIMKNTTGKLNIDGEVVYLTRDNNNRFIVKKSHDDLITIDDLINFGIQKCVTNITINHNGATYKYKGRLNQLTKVYTEKDIVKMIDLYDRGMLAILDKEIYETTKLFDTTAVNLHIIKDNHYTIILDFIPHKQRDITDFYEKGWLDFMRSRVESDQGGIIITTEKQDLPGVLPKFINTICPEEHTVLTYDKSYRDLKAQHLEFSKNIPLDSLVNLNIDVAVMDLSVAIQNWEIIYELVDNDTVVVLTVNESSMYMTLNMIIETFDKQYQYRKFIDTLLGINTLSVQQHEIKYDYIYNNKQFKILLGSKVYSKQDLESNRYKHYYLSIGGNQKSIEDTLRDILNHANEIGAHDISLSVGSPPAFRKGRDLICTFIDEKLQPYMTESMFLEIVQNPLLQERFRQNPGRGLPASYSVPGVGRYRVNVYSQRGSVAMSLRKIPSVIPTMDWCGIPKKLQDVLKNAKTGLIIVTGPTGSGKSTTLASVIEYYNQTRANKIITTEDPIEYLYSRNKSLIEQIELGQDTDSFIHTLESNMRNNPDILLIGEIRDAEVLRVALNAAVTGHLVLATLHTSGALETVQRAIDMTPIDGRENIKSLLSQNLICTTTQQLLPKIGGGLVSAHEVMISNQAIRAAIADGTPKAIGGISNILTSNKELGMQDMNYAIAQHVIKGNVSLKDAELYAPDYEKVKRYTDAKGVI